MAVQRLLRVAHLCLALAFRTDLPSHLAAGRADQASSLTVACARQVAQTGRCSSLTDGGASADACRHATGRPCGTFERHRLLAIGGLGHSPRALGELEYPRALGVGYQLRRRHKVRSIAQLLGVAQRVGRACAPVAGGANDGVQVHALGTERLGDICYASHRNTIDECRQDLLRAVINHRIVERLVLGPLATVLGLAATLITGLNPELPSRRRDERPVVCAPLLAGGNAQDGAAPGRAELTGDARPPLHGPSVRPGSHQTFGAGVGIRWE